MKVQHIRLELNKREDWLGGYFKNIALEGDGMIIADRRKVSGIACLRPIDSTQNGFSWGRVTLSVKNYSDTMIRVYAIASDNPDAIDFEAFKDCEQEKLTEKAIYRIREHYGKAAAESDDFLLSISGRYLWLALQLISTGEKSPRLNGISIQMSGDHMLDYLPIIYREGGDFTQRFLSLFDSMAMDLEKNIYALPDRFDYENVDGELLHLLADWVCLDTEGLSDAQIRKRIAECVTDYEYMYTPGGVAKSVRQLTGKTPYLIENMDVNPNRAACRNPELYRKLYGDKPNKLFILLDEDTFKTRRDMEHFLTRMRRLLPANVEFELVLLKKCVQLDWHTYLGINSQIGSYMPLSISENRTIHYDSIIGGNEK